MSLPEISDIPQPGEVLAGRYRVDELIGRGGGGVVFRAHQLGIRRDVAIKILPPELQGKDAAVRRFEREARLVSRLHHPNTVTLYEYDRTEQGLLFFVMEYVDGVPLKSVLDHEPRVPPGRAVPIMRQILKSLAEAHSHGIVHRDLKPGNVMLCNLHGEMDFVKVLDFGVATVLDADEAVIDDDVTRNADVVGTPKYMAPEQFRSDLLTPAADLYSVACVMFEMLAGYCPFDGETLHVTIARHLFQAPPTLPEDLDLYPNLVAVISRLLQKKPEERYQRAEDVLEALSYWDKPTPAFGPAAPAIARPLHVSYAAQHGPATIVDATPQPGYLSDVTSNSGVVALGDDSARFPQGQFAAFGTESGPNRQPPRLVGRPDTHPNLVHAGSSSRSGQQVGSSRPLMASAPAAHTRPDARKYLLVGLAGAALVLAIVAAVLILFTPAATETGRPEETAQPRRQPVATVPGTRRSSASTEGLEAALTASFVFENMRDVPFIGAVYGAYASPQPRVDSEARPVAKSEGVDRPKKDTVSFTFDYKPHTAVAKVRGGRARCANGQCAVKAVLGSKVTILVEAPGRAAHTETHVVKPELTIEPIRLFRR